jgi:hypothetical protein
MAESGTSRNTVSPSVGKADIQMDIGWNDLEGADLSLRHEEEWSDSDNFDTLSSASKFSKERMDRYGSGSVDTDTDNGRVPLDSDCDGSVDALMDYTGGKGLTDSDGIEALSDATMIMQCTFKNGYDGENDVICGWRSREERQRLSDKLEEMADAYEAERQGRIAMEKRCKELESETASLRGMRIRDMDVKEYKQEVRICDMDVKEYKQDVVPKEMESNTNASDTAQAMAALGLSKTERELLTSKSSSITVGKPMVYGKDKNQGPRLLQSARKLENADKWYELITGRKAGEDTDEYEVRYLQGLRNARYGETRKQLQRLGVESKQLKNMTWRGDALEVIVEKGALKRLEEVQRETRRAIKVRKTVNMRHELTKQLKYRHRDLIIERWKKGNNELLLTMGSCRVAKEIVARVNGELESFWRYGGTNWTAG